MSGIGIFHIKKSLWAVLCVLVALGCTPVQGPRDSAQQFAGILRQYPRTTEPLRVQKLSGASASPELRKAGVPEVTIIVHPAYSVFLRDLAREAYPDAKYRLLKKQFYNEATFMAERAEAGGILVLIIPGNYSTESFSPLSYTSYLNAVASRGPSVFYLFSKTSSTGVIAVDDMISLYRFLQDVNANTVMVGGGYIGRCQREFYDQLTNFIDRTRTYIAPEISTISPDDVSEREASRILAGLRRRDYTSVKQFIDRQTEGNVNILSVPRKED